MKHIRKIELDIDREYFEKIPAVQYDNNSRYLEVTLMSGVGPLDITGHTVIVSGYKPDGTEIFNSCKIVDAKKGIVEVHLSEQVSAVDGVVDANIQLFGEDSSLLSTQQFHIYVAKAFSNKNVESSNEYEGLVDALGMVSGYGNSIKKLEETKASTVYVNEQIAKAQLEGASVDTSTLVFKSDYAPVESVVKGNIISFNEYSKVEVSAVDGNTLINSLYGEDEEGFMTVNHTFTCQSSKQIAYTLPTRASELAPVRIQVQADATMKNPYVALGTSFYWGAMKRIMLKPGVLTDIIIDPKEVPTYSDGAYMKVSIGSSNTDTFIKGRIKYEVGRVNDTKLCAYRSDISAVSLLANNAELADVATESLMSNIARCSFNAGFSIPGRADITTSQANLKITSSGNKYTIKKLPGAEVNSYFYCAYVKVPYNTLEDLSGMTNLNFKSIRGALPSPVMVSLKPTDWNPSNKGVSFDAAKPVDICSKIIQAGKDFEDAYRATNTLYLLLGFQYKKDGANSVEAAIASEVEFTLEPALPVPGSQVYATSLAASATEAIVEQSYTRVADNIHTIPIGIKLSGTRDCLIRENLDDLITMQDSPTRPGYINVAKTSTLPGSNYGGVYIKFVYGDFKNTDGDIRVDVIRNSGSMPGSCYILYGVSDWGDAPRQGTLNLPLNTTFNLKSKLLSNPDVVTGYPDRTQLYLCVVNYKPGGFDGTFDFDIKVTFSPNSSAPVRATHVSEELRRDLIDQATNGGEPYITCWGDSLTAGGGWTSHLENLLGLKVYNGGTGGEGSQTIMARQGGDVMLVDNITIPSTREPVLLATRAQGGIPTFFGKKGLPLLQGGTHHVNPCYIGEVKGELKWTGTAYNDSNGTWTFTRAEEGESVVVNRPTALRTEFDINRNSPALMVLFIGQNGGYSNLEDWVSQNKLMIEHSNCKDYIVLGLSSGTAADRAEYEQRFKKEFGRRFISLREYMSQYGLADAGLTPTDQDLAMMAEGRTPQSLLSDSVHYNDHGKKVIGYMVAKKVKELNIIK